MTIRDKFFAAMRRESGAYVPFEFGLCPALQEEFRQRTGTSAYWEYHGFPVRGVTAEYNGLFYHDWFSPSQKRQGIEEGNELRHVIDLIRSFLLFVVIFVRL